MRVGHTHPVTNATFEDVKVPSKGGKPTSPIDPRIVTMLDKHLKKIEPLVKPAMTKIFDNIGNPPGGVITPPGKPIDGTGSRSKATLGSLANGLLDGMKTYGVQNFNIPDLQLLAKGMRPSGANPDAPLPDAALRSAAQLLLGQPDKLFALDTAAGGMGAKPDGNIGIDDLYAAINHQ